MSVTVGGVTYGCDNDLERLCAGVQAAGKYLSMQVRLGNALPSEYVIEGTPFDVAEVGSLNPDNSANNLTPYRAGLSASRTNPTLVVIPPAPLPYALANGTVDIAANAYVCGYGAKVRRTGILQYAHIFTGNNAGIFGLDMIGHEDTRTKWPERFTDTTDVEPAKNGSISNGNGGGVTNDAWIVASSRSRIIVADCYAIGSLTGFARVWGGASQQLYTDNTLHDMHSDTIHLTYNTVNTTDRRNTIVNAGDDCISVVSYEKSSGSGP
ncbi:MAG: hypothetical protein ACK5LJ_00960, partial [Paracoccus sp. (in: a-proteobacteria)]